MSSQKRTYVFKGAKRVRCYEFEFSGLFEVGYRVRPYEKIVGWEDLFFEETDFNYEVGGWIFYNGSIYQIKNIARDIKNNKFVVLTDYKFPVIEDEESKRVANAQLEAFEKGRKQAKQEFEKQAALEEVVEYIEPKRGFFSRLFGRGGKK